jgi:hypothetical protein
MQLTQTSAGDSRWPTAYKDQRQPNETAANTNACFLNMMSGRKGAYSAAAYPPGCVTDFDRVVAEGPAAYLILAGVKDLATVDAIVEYMLGRGVQYVPECSEPYGSGIHRGLCAVLTEQGLVRLAWQKNASDPGNGVTVSIFEAPGISAVVQHTMHSAIYPGARCLFRAETVNNSVQIMCCTYDRVES